MMDQHTENNRIAAENVAKDDAFPSMEGIKLTRISLIENHTTNSSKHDAINAKKFYLALIYNNWYLGKFDKVWYGWNFTNWGTSGCQLDHIQILYETDLVVPELNHTPYIKHVPTECEWCDSKLPKDKDEHYHDENGLTICYNCWTETYG